MASLTRNQLRMARFGFRCLAILEDYGQGVMTMTETLEALHLLYKETKLAERLAIHRETHEHWQPVRDPGDTGHNPMDVLPGTTPPEDDPAWGMDQG